MLISKQGAVIIDWIDASRGHPLADVARTWVLVRFSGSNQTNVLKRLAMRWIQGWFIKIYLSSYFRLAPGDQTQLAAWTPVIAAARLNENIKEEEPALLSFVSSHFTMD